MVQIANSDHEKPAEIHDQALALRLDMALASGSSTSVAITAADFQLRAKQMELRRQDRQRHHHSQIWTKDFHGGPYRKANCTTGYDALLQHPDGHDKEVVPGYERPQMGPTTNFVGNHMTQGAIDMVQMQLKRRPPSPQALLESDQPSGPRLQHEPMLMLPLAANDEIDGQVTRAPDLSSMRKMLRSQRGKSRAQPTAPALQSEPGLCTIAEDEPLPIADAATVQAAIDAGAASMRQGDYVAAAQGFTRAMRSLTALQLAGPADGSGSSPTASVSAAEVLLQVAVCQREMGDCTAVILDCTAALSHSPSAEVAANALLLRASAHQAREQFGQAIQDCQAALRHQPENARAQKLLRQLQAVRSLQSSG